jgi:putative ABC transport system ATP-binding protein
MSPSTEDLNGLRVDRAEPHGERRPFPLLLVHGLWADAWVWHRWLPHAASRGWEAYAIHLRGRSGSRPAKDIGRVRLSGFVRDVRDVLEATGPVVLVGHSMGGLVAQAVASGEERVRAAVFMCSIPPRGILAVTGPLLRRSPRFLPAIFGSRAFAPGREDAAALICNASPASALDGYMAHVVQDSGTVAREVLLGSMKVDPASIRCPVLVVGAGEDRISPPSVQPKLARRYGAEIRRFPGLDHLHVVGPDGSARRMPCSIGRRGSSEAHPIGCRPFAREEGNRMQDGSAAARAVGLTKVYGQGDAAVQALRGVSVAFADGAFTAIMGASGSGKSTLLHCMAGLDAPTSGQVFIGDVDITSLSERDLTKLRRDRVGFVFQAYNLVPTLTAAENITLPIDIAGRDIDGRWFDEVVDTIGLRDRLTHRPSELSGGQQQRVAGARALVSRPEIVFADEPTGNLDSRSSAELLAFLRDAVKSHEQTIVMVTHDATSASYADRIVFLADGRVVDEMREPTADRVLDRLKSLEV